MVILQNLKKIEKFSKKIFFSILPFSLFLLIIGYILLYNYKNFNEMFLSRHIIETAFNMLWITVALTLFTDIYIKRTK